MNKVVKLLITPIVIFMAIVFVMSDCANRQSTVKEGKSGSLAIQLGKGIRKSPLPDIPPGHVSPPVMCRVWLPEVSPGPQLLPGKLQRDWISNPAWHLPFSR